MLEDLTGIRNRRLPKTGRTMINSWSFWQLEQFIRYKAQASGISGIYVDPAYTSQRCSRCGHTEKANRRGSHFQCKACGFALNSDLNGARNIAAKASNVYMVFDGADVNQPIVSDFATLPLFSQDTNHQPCAGGN